LQSEFNSIYQSNSILIVESTFSTSETWDRSFDLLKLNLKWVRYIHFSLFKTYDHQWSVRSHRIYHEKKWFFSLSIINCLFIHIQKGFLDSAKYLESSYTFFNRDRTTLKCFGWSLSNQFIILLKWSEFVNNQYVQLATGQRSSSTHSRPGDCVMNGRNILERYFPRIPPFVFSSPSPDMSSQWF
jgi:hypothetical protein